MFGKKKKIEKIKSSLIFLLYFSFHQLDRDSYNASYIKNLALEAE